MIKKLLIGLFLVLMLVPRPARAEEPINVYFFHSNACPHCAKEKLFLDKIAVKYPQIQIQALEISQPANLKILEQVVSRHQAPIPPGIVPFTSIGEKYIVGFMDEATTGQQIEEAINCAIDNQCPDVVADLVEPEPNQPKTNLPQEISLPLVGPIKLKNFSLPTLTILIALLDGFNPCAMWVLLFLISLLLGMKNRRRMWILGISFIVTSSLVYFLFLAAWLNFFLLLGLVVWIRFLIALVALVAGGFNLKSYFDHKTGCQVVNDKVRKNVFEKLKAITQKRNFVLALAGIIILALAVNLVELVCSAGLPAIFTQILALTLMARWQYYLYLLLYIFVFMLDDLLVFLTAMITLKAVGIEAKYSQLSKLIGGSLMIIIGLLLLFKPQWLMFA